MDVTAERIKRMYLNGRAKRYDMALPRSFDRWKRRAFEQSSLKSGDHILVFCCGTGLDFPHILERIGKRGKITGVDFSWQMLEKARDKVKKNGWTNIELIDADATAFQDGLNSEADAGVCTLGLSIIPDYKAAFYNLLLNVKDTGEIIIGDMQLATGQLARFNPLTVFLSKSFGGTVKGHQNSLDLFKLIKKEMTNIKKKEFFLGSYYYCIGNKKW